MGKGTDKLYITHSEWSSNDAFSANSGSRVSGKSTQPNNGSFARLPFNYCSLSLQPFKEPVCTSDGIIFDLTHILSWLVKEKNNPVDGNPLQRSDLITLHLAKNDDGEYVDPVTYKVFTENTHLVALRTTGNVFEWDTVNKFNIKSKNWNDLVNDQPFVRGDIIVLQDPHNVQSSRAMARSSHNSDETKSSESGINSSALGSSERVLKAKEAVDQARKKRQELTSSTSDPKSYRSSDSNTATNRQSQTPTNSEAFIRKNLAHYTTGKAAASFTSTGLTPHTESNLAMLSEEDHILQPHVTKETGFVRIETNAGNMTLELFPEYAPRAVWNMIRLAQKGYYRNVPFHRNVRNFMIQGGDPDGTGIGGMSIWNKPFIDEVDGPMSHDQRGVLSMANKGKDTNSSQFFITYKACKHLDKKHTIFGRIMEEENGASMNTLGKLESLSVDSKQSDSTGTSIIIRDIVVLIDPFEAYTKSDGKAGKSDPATGKGNTTGHNRLNDDDSYTWTGKRVRNNLSQPEDSSKKKDVSGVGKYLQSAVGTGGDSNPLDKAVADDDMWDRRQTKKPKSSGFQNFSGW